MMRRSNDMLPVILLPMWVSVMAVAVSEEESLDIKNADFYASAEACIADREDVSFCEKAERRANAHLPRMRESFDYYGSVSCEIDYGDCYLRPTSAGINKYYPSAVGFVVEDNASRALPVLSTNEQGVGVTKGWQNIEYDVSSAGPS